MQVHYCRFYLVAALAVRGGGVVRKQKYTQYFHGHGHGMHHHHGLKGGVGGRRSAAEVAGRFSYGGWQSWLRAGSAGPHSE